MNVVLVHIHVLGKKKKTLKKCKTYKIRKQNKRLTILQTQMNN